MTSRSPSATLSGNQSQPTKNSTGVDDKTHVMIYHAHWIKEELGLMRGGCNLVALIGGGDYGVLSNHSLYPQSVSYILYRMGSPAAVLK